MDSTFIFSFYAVNILYLRAPFSSLYPEVFFAEIHKNISNLMLKKTVLKESRLKAQKHVTLLTHTEAESFQNMCVLNNMHGNMKTGENRMGVHKKSFLM